MMTNNATVLTPTGIRAVLLGGVCLALVAACGGGESSSEAPSKPMPAKASEVEQAVEEVAVEAEEVAEAASAEAESLMESASSAVEETTEAAEDMVESATETASAMVEDAEDAAEDMADQATEQMDSVIATITGDVAKGKRVFAKCMSCHTIKEGQNRVGPSLYGIVGREAGSIENFKYSDANKNSGITWTPEVLFEYLEDPRAYMPGTKMIFPGLKSEEDRQNVIAYLQDQAK